MPGNKKAGRSSSTRAKKATTRLNKTYAGSAKAGILFPAGRCTKLLRRTQPVERVSYKAGISLASALEYLVAEVCESAGDLAKEAGFKRIKPRHLTMVVKSDD
jgi:histone H2A